MILTELWIFRQSASGACFYRKSILFARLLKQHFILKQQGRAERLCLCSFILFRSVWGLTSKLTGGDERQRNPRPTAASCWAQIK
jgi:hypothetical protein